MSTTPIASREAALRIALAARALNNLDVKAFVGALIEKLEAPLTEAKLSKLTVEDLRTLLAGDFAEQGCHVGVEPEQLKETVRLLWGQGIEHGDFPAIEAYAEGEMPGSIRVAVAANRGENLDGHFGSCDRFLVYQVGQLAIKLIDVRSTAEADGAEDKNAARSALIGDCQIVYIQSIGGPAAAKVVRAGVHPIKKPTGGPAREVLAELQGRLSCPPPWLAQIMGVPSASLARFEKNVEEEEA
ncbi:MAG: dinitrogenase iron-molybdenum cofactor biosynthesis protein [Azonexus sp.]|nr:dinitrogenase iron-molybdenum cofactor biosynthesis protein [Betaproteobacteria bacterium]MBK8919128.1 dinitrogenase iron-molybdenum cofactor biosynthesis protein [Betaproteobacteria bacterium]MBP6036550.1 dinitrogenase iron-molybdenum cofactor biosynthesis protein [Azonexus sp.]MBP6907158.1 dinitrogenase iron-molybdenum cofactor biosynthesis protein [Azonexus sp.]